MVDIGYFKITLVEHTLMLLMEVHSIFLGNMIMALWEMVDHSYLGLELVHTVGEDLFADLTFSITRNFISTCKHQSIYNFYFPEMFMTIKITYYNFAFNIYHH